MGRKVSLLVAVLVLLLAATPLVLAQEANQQNADQSQYADQYTNQAQPVAPDLKDLTSLDANGNLVVNCAALIQRLDQLAQGGEVANSPDLQLEMAQLEDLSQLCMDDGFTPADSGT